MNSNGPPLSTNAYRTIYAITISLSAFLLFQVQLIVAKYILPWYGGSASVWTTSLLFFQLLLLLGYTYSHLLVSRFSFRRQARLHLLLLAISLVGMTGLSIYWGSPILASENWKPSPGSNPVGEIFLLFSLSIGTPFLLLSATSPLLQRWMGRLQSDRSPYRLYAYSNLGSLLGLLSYPFLVEPMLRLAVQGWIWAIFYLLFALLCALCAQATLRHQASGEEPNGQSQNSSRRRPNMTELAFWFGLAFCGSTLLLAVTNQICQEVAVIPLLWVLPLSIYLLSFAICFHRERWYLRRLFLSLMALGTVLCLDLLNVPLERAVTDQIAVICLFLFAACMTCHGELARLKPATPYLTSFYLMVALGGAAGGTFVGGLAPYLFSGYWELHLGILCSWLLVLLSLFRDRRSFINLPSIRLSFLVVPTFVLTALYLMTFPVPQFFLKYDGDSYLIYSLAGILQLIFDSFHQLGAYLPALPVLAPAVWYGLAIFLFVFFTSRPDPSPGRRSRACWWIRACWFGLLAFLSFSLWNNVDGYYHNAFEVSRNFYGVTKVVEKDSKLLGLTHSLYHGQTLHGQQSTQYRKLATTYFGDRSGIGILMLNYGPPEGKRRVGILGLGIGTLASYGTPNDLFRFYEINPDVTRLASGEGGYFSYLEESAATIEIVAGDARLALESELKSPGIEPFDILVVDVFSSDSIPVHLLTKEAFAIYLRRLKPDGVLAIHITNRFLDLKPVVLGIADSMGLHKAVIRNLPRDSEEQESTWVLLSHETAHFDQPPISLVRQPESDQIDTRLWTDDFSNLFEVIKF